MSEDDTFRILKRTPFFELMNIIHHSGLSKNNFRKRGLFGEHGWTHEEYVKYYHESKESRSGLVI
jgi:hypothetical protein